jgi:MFS family permease
VIGATLRIRPGQGFRPGSGPVIAASPIAVHPPAARLFNRNFARLWLAQLVSQSGNQAFLIATTFWTADVLHSATMTGLMLAAGVLPLVILAPLTGAFADRLHSRLRIVVACDFVRGALAVLLAIGFLVGPSGWRPGMLFVTAALIGVCNAFFDPAINAFIPDLVKTDELEAANAFTQSSRQVTSLCAQGLGGILYVLAGPAILFLLDGLSFLFAGATELLIRTPHRAPCAVDLTAARPAPDFLRQAADGFRYVAAQPGMVEFLLAVAVFNALLMPMSVLLPVYATRQLHADVRWYGFLLAAISAGAIAGVTFVGARRSRMTGSSRRTLLLLAFAALGLTLAVLGQVRWRWIALALSFASGGLSGIVNVLVISIIQRQTIPEFRGRVMGLNAMMTRVLVPIGMVGGGAIADATGRNVPLVYGICGILALGTVVCLASRRPARAFLASS